MCHSKILKGIKNYFYAKPQSIYIQTQITIYICKTPILYIDLTKHESLTRSSPYSRDRGRGVLPSSPFHSRG
ncbi:unnamed protein product, partial [Musa acuminata subsp. malaccensis]